MLGCAAELRGGVRHTDAYAHPDPDANTSTDFDFSI